MKNIQINKIRTELLKLGFEVSKLELTSGNYDENGDLIETKIPTLTTDLGELGFYDDTQYLVVIIEKSCFNLQLLAFLKAYQEDISLYGFKGFLPNFPLNDETRIEDVSLYYPDEKFLQIQFDFYSLTPDLLVEELAGIKHMFLESDVHVVNQISTKI